MRSKTHGGARNTSGGTISPRPESQPWNLACPTQASIGRASILTPQRPGRGVVVSGQLAKLPNHQSSPLPPRTTTSFSITVCVSCPWGQFQMFS